MQQTTRAQLLSSVVPTLRQASIAAAALKAEVDALTAQIEHEQTVVRRGTDAAATASNAVKVRASEELPVLALFWIRGGDMHRPPQEEEQAQEQQPPSMVTLQGAAQKLLGDMDALTASVGSKMDRQSRRMRITSLVPSRKLRDTAVSVNRQLLEATQEITATTKDFPEHIHEKQQQQQQKQSASLQQAKRALVAAWEEATAIEESEEGAATATLIAKAPKE